MNTFPAWTMPIQVRTRRDIEPRTRGLRERVLDLHKQGLSLSQIAGRTGTSKSTAGRIVKGVRP